MANYASTFFYLPMLFTGISGLGGLFMNLVLRKVNKFEMKGGTKNRFSPLYARPFCPFFAGARSILPIIFFVVPPFYFLVWAMRSWCLHIIFISCHPARYTLDLAARSLLLLLCCPLTDIHCSIFISRWLMLAAIPILRCSLLAYPRSLLTDYCSLSLLAADFSLLAGLYSLHAAHCHTYAKSAKKKGSANPSTQNS